MASSSSSSIFMQFQFVMYDFSGTLWASVSIYLHVCCRVFWSTKNWRNNRFYLCVHESFWYILTTGMKGKFILKKSLHIVWIYFCLSQCRVFVFLPVVQNCFLNTHVHGEYLTLTLDKIVIWTTNKTAATLSIIIPISLGVNPIPSKYAKRSKVVLKFLWKNRRIKTHRRVDSMQD